jgi:hypothetical protein
MGFSTHPPRFLVPLMNGGFLKFLLAALAVWRVSQLLAREDGPWDILARVRRFGGRLFDCFYCLSLWVAIPAALWFRTSLADSVILWLALSGAACLLDRLTPEPVVIEHLPTAAVQAKPSEGRET